MTELSIKDNTLTSTFAIPHANCLDTGLFYCSAVNIIGKSKSIGANVNVLCKPRPDYRVSLEFKQGLEYGETLNISGKLISNPQPTIHWSMRQNGSIVTRSLTNNKDNFEFHTYWKVPTITYQATRINMTPDDFGDYLMNAENEHGNYTMSFEISERRRPDGPELVSITCQPDTSVEIKFKPKFNGGGTQSFFIVMKAESDAVFQNVGEKEPENDEDEMTLKGPILESGVSYVFHVISTNSYGYASSTDHLRCTIPKEFDFSAVIGGVVAGGAVIIAMVIIAVVLCKRRRTEKSDVIETMNDMPLNANQDELEDGMKSNILYASAGPRDKQTHKNDNAQKETSVSAVYAEVVKPKIKKVNNDVYAEVIKSKGKSDGKKGKGKKTKQYQQNGDVYENAPKIDASKEQSSRVVNKRCLVYVDVEIKGKDTNQKKSVIHGVENKNEYADVDFTRRADPLPSDDEDDKTPE